MFFNFLPGITAPKLKGARTGLDSNHVTTGLKRSASTAAISVCHGRQVAALRNNELLKFDEHIDLDAQAGFVIHNAT